MISKMPFAHNVENQEQSGEGEVTYRVPVLGPCGVCLNQAIFDKITADKQRVVSYRQDLQEFQNWKGSQPKATA